MAEHPPRRPRREEDEDDSLGVLPVVTREAEGEKEGEENVDLQGGPAGEDGTRAEWKTSMGSLIGRVQEKLNVASERFTTSKEYLNARAKEIDARAEMSGMEKLFRKMGENYNKLNFVHKLGIGLTLGAGVAISVASFAPLMALGFGAALGAQRAFALGGMFVSQEKALQAKKVGESEQFISVKERAMLGAMLYTLGMSFAIKEGVELANEYGVAERTREWLGEMLGHGTTATETPVIVADTSPQEAVSAPEVPVAETPAEVAAPPTEPAAPAVAADTEVPAVPDVSEVPSVSVEATRGHGYEYMMKRVWEQLQDKGLDASQYAEGSDIRRLLEADAQSIDRVVHQIAADPEHGFFNPDGTSVRIDMGSQMTINADGNIQLGEVVKAPEGAPVTPPYNPEASAPEAGASAAPETSAQEIAPPESAAAGTTYASESAGESYIETSPASAADEIATQSPAPIEDRSFVSNRFGVPIPIAEPHIYAGADTKSTFVFGGTPVERAKLIQQYLTENPNKVVFAADSNGAHRIPWHLVDGKAIPELPVRAEGFFNSIFNFFRGSSWMKPPGPDDLRQLIK